MEELNASEVAARLAAGGAAAPVLVDELDRSRAVIVMCHHGSRSRQVATWLAGQGFADVANFDGGIDAWSRLIDSSIPRY